MVRAFFLSKTCIYLMARSLSRQNSRTRRILFSQREFSALCLSNNAARFKITNILLVLPFPREFPALPQKFSRRKIADTVSL